MTPGLRAPVGLAFGLLQGESEAPGGGGGSLLPRRVADLLQTTVLGNTVVQWTLSLAILAAVLIALPLLIRSAARRLKARATRTAWTGDDLLADLLGRTKIFFFLLVAAWAACVPLTLPDVWVERIRAVAIVGALLQAGLWANGVVLYAIDRWLKRRAGEDASRATILGIFPVLARGAVWAVVLLLGLQNLGIKITPLLGGLGIGAVAVGLAVQNILGDLLASLAIVLDKPFQVGDFIIVGDLLGTVEHIGLKTTRVRSLSGEQLIFSNNDLLGSRIRNFKRMYERRVVFSVGVTYQTPREKLERIPVMIREITEGIEEARFDRSHFQKFGDFSLDFETVYYVRKPDYNLYMDVQQRINLEIFRRFGEEGIEFAYPTQTLFVAKSGGA